MQQRKSSHKNHVGTIYLKGGYEWNFLFSKGASIQMNVSPLSSPIGLWNLIYLNWLVVPWEFYQWSDAKTH